jgi:hypothetical protein
MLCVNTTRKVLMAALKKKKRYLRWTAAVGAVGLLATGLAVGPALGDHGLETLTGSNFEIDTDANIVQDHDDPSLDWVLEGGVLVGDGEDIVFPDVPSGKNDDSFGQGSKEDTPEPVVVSGSIPPNKSDLKEFGVYVEEGSPGFLNLFWSRVQDPSGTTNMDFEFNENKCEIDNGTPTADSKCSANGITPLREEGDLLITYDLSKGGTVPSLSLRRWDGTVWGPAGTLAGSTDAAGSINTSPIEAEGGLGPYGPRTFGEAQINLEAIFDPAKCESFGSAYLKSRSSDSFTAAMKDFIAPRPVNLTNCGSIEITKTDDEGTKLQGVDFTLYEEKGNDEVFNPLPGDGSHAIDPIATNPDGDDQVCTTDASGTCTIADIIVGAYWVNETGGLEGYDVDPDLPQLITIEDQTTLELSYENPRKRGSILVEKVVKGSGGERLDGAAFVLDQDGDLGTGWDQVPIPGVEDETGLFCIDELLFSDSPTPDYTVIETPPTGYSGEGPKKVTVDSASTCDDRSDEPDVIFKNVAQPTLTTKANQTVTVGESVSDTATLSDAFVPADLADDENIGTITFEAFDSEDACNAPTADNKLFSESVNVTGNGSYGPVSFTTDAVGKVYWKATFVPSSASNAGATHACGVDGEVDTVQKAEPSLATRAAETVTVGEKVHDTATLSSAFVPADLADDENIGTITFEAFSSVDACDANVDGTELTSKSRDVTGNGDYGPVSYTTDSVGKVYWKATYSGDANNAGATHDCGADGEVDTVNPADTTLTTSPWLYPNDTANLDGGFGTLKGDIQFSLHAGEVCTGDPLYTETVNVDGTGEYTTDNTDYRITADGTYSWEVTYTPGGSNNNGSASACGVEKYYVDITPDPTP